MPHRRATHAGSWYLNSGNQMFRWSFLRAPWHSFYEHRTISLFFEWLFLVPIECRIGIGRSNEKHWAELDIYTYRLLDFRLKAICKMSTRIEIVRICSIMKIDCLQKMNWVISWRIGWTKLSWTMGQLEPLLHRKYFDQSVHYAMLLWYFIDNIDMSSVRALDTWIRHAGYSYCGACAAFAYRQVSPAVV